MSNLPPPDYTSDPYQPGPILDDITVQKFAAIIPISCCMLTDTTGVNHCNHEQPVYRGPSRRERFRRWFKAKKYRFVIWLARLDEDEICEERRCTCGY